LAKFWLKTKVHTKVVRTYPVRMANVTLAIEDKLLEKSRQYASQRGTSLNAILREMLANLTNET